MQCRRYVSLTDPISGRQVRRIVHFGSLGKDTNGHAIFYNNGKLTHKKYLSYKFIFGYGVPEIVNAYGIDSTYSGPYYTKTHPVTISEIEGADVNIPYDSESNLSMEYSLGNTIKSNNVVVPNGTDITTKFTHDANTWNCCSEIIEYDDSITKTINVSSADVDLSGVISMKYVLDSCPCGTIYFDIDTGNHYLRFNNGVCKWLDVTNWIVNLGIGYNKNSEIYFGRGYPNEKTTKGITDDYTSNIRDMLSNPNDGSYYVDTDTWILYVYGSGTDGETDWDVVNNPDLNDEKNRPIELNGITFKTSVDINKMFDQIDRHGNYAKKQEAVAHSLNQKLSILEGEIWNRIDKGWPLMNKSNKLIYDTYLLDTISNHPKVVSISDFQSKSENRHYSAYVRIESIYGSSEINISK